jgi:hypothetical protein
MMRRTILVLICAIGLAVSASRADAQGIPVICTSCPTEIQTAIRFGKELAEYAKQLGELQRIYVQARAAYDAITGIRDLGSAAGALGTLGINNPLPINPNAVQALMNGSGGVSGMLNSVSALYTGNQNNLKIFDCTVQNVACRLMNQFRDETAGSQATAMQLYQSAGERQTAIGSLQAQIALAQDPATREALTAQLTAANAQSTSQLVQATAMQTYANGMVAQREQRLNEDLKRQIAEVLEEAQGRIR